MLKLFLRVLQELSGWKECVRLHFIKILKEDSDNVTVAKSDEYFKCYQKYGLIMYQTTKSDSYLKL